MKYRELFNRFKSEMLNNNLEDANAIVFMKHLLGDNFYTYLEDDVSNENITFSNNVIELLKNDEFIEYILGYTYFYGLKINVNKNCLIPRDETEELVEYLLNNITKEDATVLDFGTGSGCIALAIKKHRPRWNVIGLDVSKEALEIAKENAKQLNLDVKFIESDGFENVDFDIDYVISNPPYIEENDPDVDLKTFKHEPHLALFALDKGLYFYKLLKVECLKRNVLELYIEYGYKQKQDILNIYSSSNVETKKDLNKNDRIARIIF